METKTLVLKKNEKGHSGYLRNIITIEVFCPRQQ